MWRIVKWRVCVCVCEKKPYKSEGCASVWDATDRCLKSSGASECAGGCCQWRYWCSSWRASVQRARRRCRRPGCSGCYYCCWSCSSRCLNHHMQLTERQREKKETESGCMFASCSLASSSRATIHPPLCALVSLFRLFESRFSFCFYYRCLWS